MEISDKIKQLPKRGLKKWISDREKENRSQDWKRELEKLKERLKDEPKKSRRESPKD